MIKSLAAEALPSIQRLRYLDWSDEERILEELTNLRKFNRDAKRKGWDYTYRTISVNQYLRMRDYLRVIRAEGKLENTSM